ncbi:MAG: zinc-ribbon domain-containing protein [Clostridia bacterium]|nr:zinc-ribbon domain-containing protein [Clostridia bacterium]
MAKCTKCGAELEAGVKFCQSCGTKVEADQAQTEQPKAEASKGTSINTEELVDTLKNLNDTEDTTSEFEQSDIDSNKVMGVLAYLGWLVLIPIIAASKSKFARFHSNQGLVLAIVEVIWGIATNVVVSILSAIFGLIGLHFLVTIISAVLNLVNLLFFVAAIIGIVNVVNGRAKELPIIGKIRLIK